MPIILATVLIINMVLFVAKLKNDSIATNASLQIAQGLAWAVIAVCNWNDGHRASVVFCRNEPYFIQKRLSNYFLSI